MKKYTHVIAVFLVFFLLCGIFLTAAAVKNSNRREVQLDYMQSENLAENAKVSANSGRLTAGFAADKNNATFWAGRRENAVLRLDFGKQVTFNTVIINEIGFNISSFALRVSSDGENFEEIYRQERIETQRLCALKEPAQAQYLELVIESSDAVPKIGTIGVFNEEKRAAEDFDVVGYIVPGNHISELNELAQLGKEPSYEELYELLEGEKFDVYNTVNLIAAVGWDENAEIYYSLSSEFKEYSQADKKVIFDNYIAALRRVIGDRDVRINITFMNPSDNPVCVKSMTGENKTKLAANMVDFLNKNGFDGVDIDWEYPISQEEFDAYNAFLVELKSQMEKANPDYELSLAVSTWAYKYSPEAVKAIDKLQLMGYDILDQNGDHGGFYGSAVQAVEYCLSYGFKPEQINLGMGLYGTYKEGKMEQYGPGGAVEEYEWFKNIYTCMSGEYEVDDIYFNGGQMLYDKIAYASYKNLSGIMTWHMYNEFEATKEYQYPLLQAMEKGVNDRTEGAN